MVAGVLIRAEQISDRLIEQGKAIQGKGERIRKIIEDGVVDDEELQDLFSIAREAEQLGFEVEDAALDVQDVGADILTARQVLNLGRHATPNRHLQDHCTEIDRRLKERAEGQEESPAMVEIEGLQTLGKLAA